MEVYSKKILAFLAKQRRVMKQIMVTEMKLAVAKTRFVYRGYSYPIQLVLFEDSILCLKFQNVYVKFQNVYVKFQTII